MFLHAAAIIDPLAERAASRLDRHDQGQLHSFWTHASMRIYGWMDGWMDVPTLILAECSKARTRERDFASDGGSSRVDEYQTLPRPTPRVPDQLPPNTTSESIPSFFYFFILIHCSYPTSFLIMRSLD